MRNLLSPFAQLKKALCPKPEATPNKTPPPSKKPPSAKALVGIRGENAAAEQIKALGWCILDRNWRHGSLELDIVALEKNAHAGDVIVFLEVKTRTIGGLTSPVDALTPTKQERLTRVARHWLDAHNAWDRPCRFDLAAVTAHNDEFTTELFHNVIELGDSNNASQWRKGGRSSGGGNAAWQPW